LGLLVLTQNLVKVAFDQI